MDTYSARIRSKKWWVLHQWNGIVCSFQMISVESISMQQWNMSSQHWFTISFTCGLIPNVIALSFRRITMQTQWKENGKWDAYSFLSLFFKWSSIFSHIFYYSAVKTFYPSTDIISLRYSELSKSRLSEDILKFLWAWRVWNELSNHVKQSVQGIKQKKWNSNALEVIPSLRADLQVSLSGCREKGEYVPYKIL